MTIEVRPLGVACNISCEYCYQAVQRSVRVAPPRYDMAAMKRSLAKEGGAFTVFGGEPLLLHEEDLEDLWKFGLEKFGRNAVQTNGTLIDEKMIRLFRKYKVHVGISIDGPAELNDARWAGTLELTRKRTEATERAIKRLCQVGLPPSLIVNLHRGNASSEALPRLCEWFGRLDELGVVSARLHILEIESPNVAERWALSARENIEAFLAAANLENELTSLRFDLFADMRNLLMGNDGKASCVWRGCDPYTTGAVQGIEWDGSRSNCGRTCKDGVEHIKANAPGYERCLALYFTPQRHGGCGGCRFFLMCRGQCPGNAIDGDWRNRTEHCEVWRALYRHLEEELLDSRLVPISVRHRVRDRVEQEMVESWAGGRQLTMEAVLKRLDGDPCRGTERGGARCRNYTDHGDAPHRDSGQASGELR